MLKLVHCPSNWFLEALEKRDIMKTQILKGSSHRCYTNMSQSLAAFPEVQDYAWPKYLKIIVHSPSHFSSAASCPPNPCKTCVPRGCGVTWGQSWGSGVSRAQTLSTGSPTPSPPHCTPRSLQHPEQLLNCSRNRIVKAIKHKYIWRAVQTAF